MSPGLAVLDCSPTYPGAVAASTEQTYAMFIDTATDWDPTLRLIDAHMRTKCQKVRRCSGAPHDARACGSDT